MINRNPETDNMKFSFTDEDLRQAALILQEAFADIQPRPVDLEHKFSERFSEKINAIISRQKKTFMIRRVIKNIAAAVLAVIIGCGIWLSTDAEARAEFIEWLRTEYEDSILYEFFGKKEGREISSVEFGWLPKGYTEAEALIEERSGHYLFTNSNGEDIIFYYTCMDHDAAFVVFSGCAAYERVSVNGAAADFYADLDEGESNILWWCDEEKEIAFVLNAALEKQELVKIAERITLKFG